MKIIYFVKLVLSCLNTLTFTNSVYFSAIATFLHISIYIQQLEHYCFILCLKLLKNNNNSNNNNNKNNKNNNNNNNNNNIIISYSTNAWGIWAFRQRTRCGVPCRLSYKLISCKRGWNNCSNKYQALDFVYVEVLNVNPCKHRNSVLLLTVSRAQFPYLDKLLDMGFI